MKVNELIEDLLNADPEIEVVLPGSDHSYIEAYSQGEIEAYYATDENHISEHAPGYTAEDYGYPGEVRSVFVIS